MKGRNHVKVKNEGGEVVFSPSQRYRSEEIPPAVPMRGTGYVLTHVFILSVTNLVLNKLV